MPGLDRLMPTGIDLRMQGLSDAGQRLSEDGRFWAELDGDCPMPDRA
jgi:hypothetical protein